MWLVVESMDLETDVNSDPEYSINWLNYLRQILIGIQRIMSFKMEKKCRNRNIGILLRSMDINSRNLSYILE